ncbi:MAG TPA: hypothetical protein VFB58_06270 [Chloroflexota bacterium]|nr:hypothetical protein [Chloroflexota bacterium]
MEEHLPSTRRLIVVALIAAAVLFGLVIAMGGVTITSPSSIAVVTVLPTPKTAPPTTQPTGQVKGRVTLSVQRLAAGTWRFRYTVHDTGTLPIAGFQVNGPTANLYHIVNPGWIFFGSGVCGQKHPGLLIYWSTNSTPIEPGKAATFGFDVKTRGTIHAIYSVSYGTSAPEFGSTRGPAASSIPAAGSCH